jgi:hypothetical protein|tara:strand:+ start:738 stop:1007 length:270 start_codon:yes stop_codon:yes gene_type:complete
MGKLNEQQVDKLEDSGRISKEEANNAKKQGLSKRKVAISKYMKTADGKWVQPMLYFRGSQGADQSKRMNEFVNKFNKLVEEYGTERPGA